MFLTILLLLASLGSGVAQDKKLPRGYDAKEVKFFETKFHRDPMTYYPEEIWALANPKYPYAELITNSSSSPRITVPLSAGRPLHRGCMNLKIHNAVTDYHAVELHNWAECSFYRDEDCKGKLLWKSPQHDGKSKPEEATVKHDFPSTLTAEERTIKSANCTAHVGYADDYVLDTESYFFNQEPLRITDLRVFSRENLTGYCLRIPAGRCRKLKNERFWTVPGSILLPMLKSDGRCELFPDRQCRSKGIDISKGGTVKIAHEKELAIAMSEGGAYVKCKRTFF